MKRVLITGGNGFVGSNLMRFLVSRQYECWNHHRGTNLADLLEQVQPDIILNCAAEIYDAAKMYDVNVGMTMQLIEWCHQHGTRMIHFGSSSEYGRHDEPTTEHHALYPENCYAGSKAAATVLCQGYAQQHGLDIVIARLYSPYGPGEKPHRLFPRLWQAFEKGREMKLVEGVHDFTHIDDVVTAIDCILNSRDRAPGEIINICSGKQYKNSNVLAYFQLSYHRQGAVDFDSSVMSTWPTWQGDNSLLTNKYGWVPDFELEDGIYRFTRTAYYE